MKLTTKFALGACLVIWVMAVLPFFVPALNSMEPLVFGLPFVVFWEGLALVLHIVLLFICEKYVWDGFDGGEQA